MTLSGLAIGLAFLAAAIPRAGVKVGAFPIPIMLLGLMLSFLLFIFRDHQIVSSPSICLTGTTLWVLLTFFGWVACRLTILASTGASLWHVLLVSGWSLTPGTILALGRANRRRASSAQSRNWTRALELGILVACGFSVVQLLFGIEQTAVPGITIAAGDSYQDKYLGPLDSTASKIPSTYHNGNIFGVVAGFFCVAAANRLARHRFRPWDIWLAIGTAIATLLSGSRTVILGLLVGLALSLLSRGSTQRKILSVLVLATVPILLFQLIGGVPARYSLSSLLDPGGGGRTQMWSGLLRKITPAELIFGSNSWIGRSGQTGGLVEGALGIVQQIGLVGLLLGVVLFIVCTSDAEGKRWRTPSVVLAVAVLLDSSYLSFPTLFLPFARMATAFNPEESPGVDQRPLEQGDMRGHATQAGS